MVSEVRHFAAERPGIGGTTGLEPAAMTMARVVSVRVAPALLISTDHGETILACPSRTSAPSAV